MEKQVKTINVDDMYMSGKKDVCKSYVMSCKIKRKYINHIQENMNDFCIEVSKNKFFCDNKNKNKQRLHSLFDYIINNFDNYELKELLSKDLSYTDFIYKAYDIRRRNFNETS